MCGNRIRYHVQQASEWIVELNQPLRGRFRENGIWHRHVRRENANKDMNMQNKYPNEQQLIISNVQCFPVYPISHMYTRIKIRISTEQYVYIVQNVQQIITRPDHNLVTIFCVILQNVFLLGKLNKYNNNDDVLMTE